MIKPELFDFMVQGDMPNAKVDGFCVGAVCVVCGNDISKDTIRLIVGVTYMYHHVCLSCGDKALRRRIELKEKEIIDQHINEFRKSVEDFKKRIS